MRLITRLAGFALLFLAEARLPATAAEFELPAPAGQNRTQPSCGPCGCTSVIYVYHRELKSTYGLSFDPRSYDQTEPSYYLGPPRAYPRYISGCRAYSSLCQEVR